MILVDTNIVVDVLTGDPNWSEWSIIAIRDNAAGNRLCVNEVIYAELAVRIAEEGQLTQILSDMNCQLERMPTAALHLAGRTFGRYRDRGGLRTNVLPDFFIGAHAQTSGMRILTRDLRRFRTYFPDVELIAP
ncbi:MAG TPA: type II toxin-antitoxin system VapC family toxin [Rhizomicrobium sp.]